MFTDDVDVRSIAGGGAFGVRPRAFGSTGEAGGAAEGRAGRRRHGG